MKSGMIVFIVAVAVVGSSWVYTWPYDDGKNCKCTEKSIATSYLTFGSAEECLVSFAKEADEFCNYEGEGLTVGKCDYAVSVKEGLFNSDCRVLCTEYIIGTVSVDEFFSSCSLEMTPFIHEDNSVLAMPEGCYSNYVYGWADYDVHNELQATPLAMYTQVDSAAECQELCQLTSDCVLFNWRGITTSGSNGGTTTSSGTTYAAKTCYLYNADYVNSVLAAGSDITSSAFCNYQEFADHGCKWDVLNSTTYNPFTIPNCLLCDCVQKCAWKDIAHITGPRFCGDDNHDVCNFPLSPVTTTSTAPICPTETCQEETTTAIQLDTTTTTHDGTETTIQLDTTTEHYTTATGRYTGSAPTENTATCVELGSCECDDEFNDDC